MESKLCPTAASLETSASTEGDGLHSGGIGHGAGGGVPLITVSGGDPSGAGGCAGSVWPPADEPDDAEADAEAPDSECTDTDPDPVDPCCWSNVQRSWSFADGVVVLVELEPSGGPGRVG